MRLRKYALTASKSARNKLIYRGNSFGAVVTYGLFVFVFARIWASAYAGRSSIAGYDYPMSVWYFIVAEITVFGFGRFFWSLAEDVKNGQVAYLLGRPYSFVGYHYAQAMGAGLVDAAVLIVEGLAAGLILAGPPPQASILRLAGVIASLLLAGSLQFFLQMSLAMTAFWVEENTAFFWIFQKLTLVVGTLLPLEFLPEGARRLALFTPLPSLSYAPARIAVAASLPEALRLLAFQAAWIAGAAALAGLVFHRGRRRIAIQGG
jgi:ABC-2 type transport system permease protein